MSVPLFYREANETTIDRECNKPKTPSILSLAMAAGALSIKNDINVILVSLDTIDDYRE